MVFESYVNACNYYLTSLCYLRVILKKMKAKMTRQTFGISFVLQRNFSGNSVNETTYFLKDC